MDDGTRWCALALVAVLLLAGAAVPAGAGDQLSTEAVQLTFPESQGRFAVTITNGLPVPVTASVKLELDNMETESGGTDFLVVVPANAERVLAILNPTDPFLPYYYRYSWHWRFGDAFGSQAALGTFRLPYRDGEAYPIVEAYGGEPGHHGEMHYSLDWDMPVGTPLVAARGGVVVATESGFDGNGGEEYRDRANYVVICHDDGSLADYVHLRQDGVAVAPGDRVNAGDLIGYSGHTGWSLSPHLHFRIYRPLDGTATAGLPTTYWTAEAGETMLSVGDRYTAAPVPPPPPPPEEETPAPVQSSSKH